jgi:alpha-amylase/alpha-mannosidase (GH57 family)
LKPLNVAIIWSYNQPYLKDRHGNFVLPSIRQYLQRDYIDMIKIAKKYPSVRLTFNVTPFLFEQVSDYVFSDPKDYTWLLSQKTTDELSLQEKEFILRHFFKGVDAVIVDPYPRYAELYEKKRKLEAKTYVDGIAPLFSESEIRDLQVWHNLAWIGKESQKDRFVKSLIEKGAFYTEGEKAKLLTFIRSLHQSMFELYNAEFQTHHIELSTTAFYNPIIPLVVDNQAVKLKDDKHLPLRRFTSEEFVMEQILQARKFNKKFFNQTSLGIQSPEGMLNKKALDLFAKARFSWTVLEKHHVAFSLKENEMLYPYEYTSNNQHFINCFVNFSEISDRFKTDYPKLTPKAAVADIMMRLEKARLLAEDVGHQEAIVVLPLSGDTLWDLYQRTGTEFLHLLYRALEKSTSIKTTTPMDYLAKQPISTLINSVIEESPDINYEPWIGSAAANRAWDKVTETYKFYLSCVDSGEYSEETLKEAKLCIQKALNADWFKWYSDHDSIWDTYYDELFRSLLIQSYEILYKKSPISLFYNLKNASSLLKPTTVAQNAIYPKIDGEDTSLVEWEGAAIFDVNRFQLEAGNPLYTYLSSISLGYNELHLCVHISFIKFPMILSHLRIEFHQPVHCIYEFHPLQEHAERHVEILSEKGGDDRLEIQQTAAEFAVDHVWECLIPLSELKVEEGDMITMQFWLGEKESIIERFPQSSTISLNYSMNFESI